MKETSQLRKLMEAVDTPYAELKTEIKEDWGSSDWYAVIKSMDKHIDQYGLSPDSIMDAARDAAIFWGDMMGHDMHTRDGEEDAIQDCKDGWLRMSERGQKLQRMFAPANEGITEEVNEYTTRVLDDMFEGLQEFAQALPEPYSNRLTDMLQDYLERLAQ